MNAIVEAPIPVFATMPQALAASVGSDGHIHMHARRSEDACVISRAELVTRGCAAARLFRDRGVEPGERVLAILPTSEAFLATIFGTWFAGGVFVPLACPPPGAQVEAYLRKLTAILLIAAPRVIVGTREVLATLSNLGALLDGVRLVTSDEIDDLPTRRDEAPLYEPQAEDIAHIQFTSGSTGFPRGASITHGNITANLSAVGFAIDIAEDDGFVSWLPVHHDMGFIGGILCALFHGLELHLIPTENFIRDPSVWLQVMTAARATLSPAPPFAYDLLATRVGANRLEGVDLSAWRHAWIGAEPIFQDTLERFINRFRSYGLRDHVLHPCYGLAEATLAVTHSPLYQPHKVERVGLDALHSLNYAAHAAPDAPHPMSIISCGRAIPETELRVVDENDVALADRHQGRIQVRGSSVMRGYFGQTEHPFTADGWLDTGDLGFLLNAELYVTGRAKDLIIRGGANIHPHEIEHAAQSVPGVRLGRAAAFSIVRHDEGREEIVLVVETKERDEAERARIVDEVMRETIRQAGVRVDRVELAPPGFIPKTTSGKIQRSLCREKMLCLATKGA